MISYRNCSTCKNDTPFKGCVLRERAGICATSNFMYYEKDESKKLLKCERCGNTSVREYIGGIHIIPRNPHISFWCLTCDDYPIINGKLLSKKELSDEDRNYWIKESEKINIFI